ncbi:hypothetical protein BpHYR1_006244 [Brachionus plicatilis]|uniref:Uncharacterized protein n=1 Tax=Brachionus plicatilis TaxID=10195 RepID=A0A3M7RY35_BRAPC|nr:hypothetical protein BpHYR1_006244 [Brachionus plicatilis]
MHKYQVLRKYKYTVPSNGGTISRALARDILMSKSESFGFFRLFPTITHIRYKAFNFFLIFSLQIIEMKNRIYMIPNK